MKVLLTGSHGSGKSTLAELLGASLDWPLVKEGAREILKRHDVREELNILPIAQRVEIQQEILEWHSAEREKYKECIEDRGIVDVLAYSSYWLSREVEAQEFIARLGQQVDEFSAKGSYDKIIVCPPTIPLISDGVRADQPAYRDTIHYLILGILERYSFKYNVLESISLADRLRESLKIIRRPNG